MRKSLGWAISLVLLMALCASATPVCTTNNFSVTMATAPCDDNNVLEFSDFGLTATASPPAIAIGATSIIDTPITIGPNDIGLQWNLGMSVVSLVGSSSFQDDYLTFEVTGINGNMLDGVDLTFNGSFTGTGTSSVTETVCTNHTIIGCPTGDLYQIIVTNPPPNYNNQIAFSSPASWIDVSKDVNVTSGTSGTAYISSFDNSFEYTSSVPEPITFSMVGFGLLGLGFARRRFVRRK